MNIHDDEFVLAKDASGHWVSIEDIPIEKRGLACGCFCPKCKKSVIARIGQKRRPHFAHGSRCECHGGNMTILHMLAEEIIAREKKVMTPGYKIIPPERFSFVEIFRQRAFGTATEQLSAVLQRHDLCRRFLLGFSFYRMLVLGFTFILEH